VSVLRSMLVQTLIGSDTSTFGSLQALPSWLNQFGTNGSLTTLQKALANSS
jgi:SP family sugar:H+ symporter-like MFS transporter